MERKYKISNLKGVVRTWTYTLAKLCKRANPLTKRKQSISQAKTEKDFKNAQQVYVKSRFTWGLWSSVGEFAAGQTATEFTDLMWWWYLTVYTSFLGSVLLLLYTRFIKTTLCKQTFASLHSYCTTPATQKKNKTKTSHMHLGRSRGHGICTVTICCIVSLS